MVQRADAKIYNSLLQSNALDILDLRRPILEQRLMRLSVELGGALK